MASGRCQIRPSKHQRGGRTRRRTTRRSRTRTRRGKRGVSFPCAHHPRASLANIHTAALRRPRPAQKVRQLRDLDVLQQPRQKRPGACSRNAERILLSQLFSLCLSRACLGKMIVFSNSNGAKNAVCAPLQRRERHCEGVPRERRQIHLLQNVRLALCTSQDNITQQRPKENASLF